MPTRSMRSKLAKVDSLLAPLYPENVPLLRYGTPFQLLIAVILSAQTTDEQVNGVTGDLFSRWPDPASLSVAEAEELEACIHSVGFFRSKARYLIETARAITVAHGGRVPDSIDELVTLPGVGRKTANLVASAIYGHPGLIVDTHVLRVGTRLGIPFSGGADGLERALAELAPAERWTALSYELNRHGKFTCVARSPHCARCAIAALCPSRGR